MHRRTYPVGSASLGNPDCCSGHSQTFRTFRRARSRGKVVRGPGTGAPWGESVPAGSAVERGGLTRARASAPLSAGWGSVGGPAHEEKPCGDNQREPARLRLRRCSFSRIGSEDRRRWHRCRVVTVSQTVSTVTEGLFRETSCPRN